MVPGHCSSVRIVLSLHVAGPKGRTRGRRMAQASDGWYLDGTSMTLIREGIKALASVCDGARTDDSAGFNGADAEFGHKLAALPNAWWTPARYYAAWKMLAKYRVQLGKLGVTYADIQPVADPKSMTAPIRGMEAPYKLLELDMGPMVHDYHEMAERNPGGPEISYLQGRGISSHALPVHPSTPANPFGVDVTNHEDHVRTILEGPVEAVAAGIRALGKPVMRARDILGPGGVIAGKLTGYEARDSQLELADIIETAMDAGANAVTEAGTGTGKSLAYLVPAILMSYREPADKGPKLRTIVSTGDKALQEQIWRKDIPFLHDVMPRPFRAALLKGRSNYLCLYRLRITEKGEESPELDLFEDEPAGEPLAHLVDVMEWSKSTATGDLEELPFSVTGALREAVAIDSEGCLGQRCPAFKSCWAERAKAKAKDADLIIVNHALLLRDLALRVSSGGAVGVLPESDIVIIDEAHHLEDVATDSFGIELSESGWSKLAREWKRLTIEHEGVPAKDETDENTIMARQYVAIIEAVGTSLGGYFDIVGERMREQSKTQDLLGDDYPLVARGLTILMDTATSMAEATPYWLKDPAERERWGKLAGRLSEYGGNFITCVSTPPAAGLVVRYAEAAGSGRFARIVLHVKPIDVSDILRDGLFDSKDFRSIIATSATIATSGADPFHFWRSRVGANGERETMTVQVDSPFDYQHHALLYLPNDGRAFDPTQSRQDGSVEYLDRLAGEYERLILSSDGRAFALFTSFRTLNEVYRRLSPRLSRYLVLRQGDMPRPELVRQFREHGQAVLFGVKSFWEGVDVQGPALSLVIIDKLPFATPDDPIWEARKNAITERARLRGVRDWNWAWFNELAIPNAIIALKQGFGRLIRTKTDRGVVAILDGRLSTKGYGPTIIRALPPATQTRSHEAVRAFYGQ